MATYEPATRTIALPPFEVGGRWALRATVVLHELTHHLSGEQHHTPLWRATFLRLLEDAGLPVTAQLMQLAYAAEGLEQVAHSVDDGTLARLAKLLRQAERATNEHERAAFLSKAQALATRHSVALAVARAHTAKEEGREQPVAENYRIGDRGKRGLARYVRLLLNIAHANDIRCTISHDSTALTMHGFPSDIAVTKAIYESLLVQMVADCERHLRLGHPRRADGLGLVAPALRRPPGRHHHRPAGVLRGLRVADRRAARRSPPGRARRGGRRRRPRPSPARPLSRCARRSSTSTTSSPRRCAATTSAAPGRPTAVPRSTTPRGPPRKASAPPTGPGSATRRRWAKRADAAQRRRPIRNSPRTVPPRTLVQLK